MIKNLSESEEWEMLVEVNVKSIQQIDIDDTEAFKLLCKTLSMDIVLDEYTKFFVRQDSDGVNCVYEIIKGFELLFND